MIVEFTLNGKPVSVDVAPDEKLLDTLRNRLKILSVKRGCENGDCGACTVLLDGAAVDSCIFLTAKARGREVRTIEAFCSGDALHPLQSSLRETGAFQCGFCAPGATLSMLALLEHNPDPTDDEIIESITGNLCRCTGYVQILEGIRKYLGRDTDREEGASK